MTTAARLTSLSPPSMRSACRERSDCTEAARDADSIASLYSTLKDMCAMCNVPVRVHVLKKCCPAPPPIHASKQAPCSQSNRKRLYNVKYLRSAHPKKYGPLSKSFLLLASCSIAVQFLLHIQYISHFNNTVPRHHPPTAMHLLADPVVSIEPWGGRALCSLADLGLPISSAPPP